MRLGLGVAWRLLHGLPPPREKEGRVPAFFVKSRLFHESASVLCKPGAPPLHAGSRVESSKDARLFHPARKNKAKAWWHGRTPFIHLCKAIGTKYKKKYESLRHFIYDQLPPMTTSISLLSSTAGLAACSASHSAEARASITDAWVGAAAAAAHSSRRW